MSLVILMSLQLLMRSWGAFLYNMKKSLEFITVIEDSGLIDLCFSCKKFTWSNKRGLVYRIWKRLDRGMVNDKWLDVMPHTTITHMSFMGSDHCPLFWRCPLDQIMLSSTSNS